MNNPQANTPKASSASANGGGIVAAVKDAMTGAADQVGDAATQVGERISGAASDAYGSAKDVGHTVQEWAEDTYGATTKCVGTFEQEVGSLIRNHPIPSLLIGFGAGLLIGRVAKAI